MRRGLMYWNMEKILVMRTGLWWKTGSRLEKEQTPETGAFTLSHLQIRCQNLNTNNEEVIEYFCKVCEEWVQKFDIDGIRFDVGNEVSHRF